jgi:hypothetical protein
VIASSYAFAGALNYYGPEKGLPEVYSANASFLMWMPETYDFDHMLYVDQEYEDDQPIFKQFEKVTILDSVDMPLFREDHARMFFFENGNDSVNAMVTQFVKSEKARFLR